MELHTVCPYCHEETMVRFDDEGFEHVTCRRCNRVFLVEISITIRRMKVEGEAEIERP